MNQRDIDYFDNIVRGYLGKCVPTNCRCQDKSQYDILNVKYHIYDKVWLKAYILNQLYSEYNSSDTIYFDIFDYLASEHFDKQINRYIDNLVDEYIKHLLKNIKPATLSKIPEKKRFDYVSDMISACINQNFNVPTQVTKWKLLKKQNDIVKILTHIAGQRTLAGTEIDKL